MKALNSDLALLLEEAGWSGAELARSVNALGTLQGLGLRYDRTAVAHWLSGTRPRRPVPALIAAALTDRCGRLVTVQEAGFGPAAGPAPREDGEGEGEGEGEGLRRLALQARADADPRTRPPLLRTPYQPLPVLPWTPPQTGTETDGGPGTASSSTAAGMAGLAERRWAAARAEQLRGLARSFAGLYLAHGGAHTRAALAAWLAQDAGACAARRRPAGAEDPRELFGGYAQLAHLLGEMTADAGYHGLAREYHGIALGLARQAADRRAYAITLRAMSAHAGRLGQPGHAVRLAGLAVDTAPAEGDPGTLAFLLVQRAAARAHAGERDAALADLDTAAELDAEHAGRTGCGGRSSHSGHAPNGPGHDQGHRAPFDSYGRADLDHARARTHLALGAYPAAAEALERSLRARAPGQYRAVALTLAALAETLLRLGHVTRACEHWRAFLAALPAVQSRTATEALGRLLRDLAPYRHVREAVPVLAMAKALAAGRGLRPPPTSRPPHP